MITQMEQGFTDFFNQWMSQIYECFLILVKVSKDDESNERHQYSSSFNEELVKKVTSLHKEYYITKWAAAHEDVLAFFSPVWLTPFENAYLWITGWKPSTMFRLIDSFQNPGSPAKNITEEQVEKIQVLKIKIKAEEEIVEREMERLQVGFADRRIVQLARIVSGINNNYADKSPAVAAKVDVHVEVVVGGMLGGLEKVMKMADCVRLKALKGVLDVLNPKQSVEFLAAFSMMQIVMTKWGKKREINST